MSDEIDDRVPTSENPPPARKTQVLVSFVLLFTPIMAGQVLHQVLVREQIGRAPPSFRASEARPPELQFFLFSM